jgi:hypothetical protein
MNVPKEKGLTEKVSSSNFYSEMLINDVSIIATLRKVSEKPPNKTPNQK